VNDEIRILFPSLNSS